MESSRHNDELHVWGWWEKQWATKRFDHNIGYSPRFVFGDCGGGTARLAGKLMKHFLHLVLPIHTRSVFALSSQDLIAVWTKHTQESS